jgi:hypothetical protein
VMRMSRFTAAALVVTAALSATAACTAASTGSGVASSASGPATTSAAGSGSTSGASTTTPSGSGSTTSSGAGESAESDASACTGPEIQVTVESAGVAMNHSGDVLIFTNHTGSACTMQGYPGVAVVKGSTTLLNATRSLNGYMADDPGISSAPLVTLAPGQSASAMVEWVGNAGEACYATDTGTFQVTPPNTRSTTTLGTLTLGDDGICADFEVHPVASGILPHVTG